MPEADCTLFLRANNSNTLFEQSVKSLLWVFFIPRPVPPNECLLLRENLLGGIGIRRIRWQIHQPALPLHQHRSERWNTLSMTGTDFGSDHFPQWLMHGTAFLGLGPQLLEHHRLLGINRTFLGPVRPSLEIDQSGGRRAPTSTWCPLGTLRETVWLSPSARRSSTTRLSSFNNAPTRPRKSTPEPHETNQTSLPQYRKGRCALSMYAHDRKWIWIPHFLARQEFTASEIEYYARRRGRVEERISRKQHQSGSTRPSNTPPSPPPSPEHHHKAPHPSSRPSYMEHTITSSEA